MSITVICKLSIIVGSNHNADTVTLIMVVKCRNLGIVISQADSHHSAILRFECGILTIASMFLCAKCTS